MNSDEFQSTPGGWSWPEDLPEIRNRFPEPQSNIKREPGSQPGPQAQALPKSQQQGSKPRTWKPRTCRICLETVLPTYRTPPENLPGIFQPSTPSVTYESEEGGRLLRPCKCKGSSAYVHENCLQEWRHSDPGYARRNYYQCPTCGYSYRLGRMGWSRMISSAATQIFLTLLILVVAMFILGFIADPIIDFATNPYGFIFPSWFGSSIPPRYEIVPDDDSGWIEHFAKGFASLGLLSFLKALFTSPIQFLFRSNGVGGRNRQGGRDRLSNMTWLIIIIGVATFLYAVWKGVRAWSRRTLEKAGERVMDVQVGDDNDDEDDEEVKAEPTVG